MTRRLRVGAGVWLVALAASQLTVGLSGDATRRPRPGDVTIAAMTDRGPSEKQSRLALRHWPAAPDRADGRPVVLLLHGSPGSSDNFEALAPRLAKRGWPVWAPDLPGFGRSEAGVPSYSILAHARAGLAALDALGIERAHVVGWSMGGGVGLHMADLAPNRVASLSLIASIGVQEAEGSGSYAFEHVKYAAAYVLLVIVPEIVPHFGLFGPRGPRYAFVRNFWDTDQRPLRGIMASLGTPSLILHGRSDFLVPAWAAEQSHALIRPSRLVLLDAGHFLPLGGRLGDVDATLDHLIPFLGRHDRENVPARRGALGVAAGGRLAPGALQRAVPWWLLFAGLALLTRRFPLPAVLIAGLLVAALQLDAGLALIACGAGGVGRLFLNRNRPRMARPR